MSSTEAAKILEIASDATPEQLEARFLDLRRKLEDKIAKAPTPGLQAKYRESLATITTAFETLTLAADSSALPVLQRQRTEDGGQKTASKPAASSDSGLRSQVSGLPAPKPKASSKEFLIVAVIAIAVLGAGGWWVMHLRAEKAEEVRLAAVAAAEAIAEKARAEAAAKAEADRLSAQATVLRTKLAETRIEWEALESELRDAEHRASELKSELRGLRDVSFAQKAKQSSLTARHEMYASWLKQYLLRHPAKVLRARADELLSAKSVDEASAAVAELEQELHAAAESIVPDNKRYFLETTGWIVPMSSPSVVSH